MDFSYTTQLLSGGSKMVHILYYLNFGLKALINHFQRDHLFSVIFYFIQVNNILILGETSIVSLKLSLEWQQQSALGKWFFSFI